jgi:uncharacterized membrane protein
VIGFLAKVSGIVVGTRALTNMNLRQMSGMTQEGDAIQLRKEMRINVPVDQVYQLWSNFENFPRFMENVEAIHNLGGSRSHWVVKGPAGSRVEFNAIETENVPEERIAWETTPDSTVKHRGQVRFKSVGRDSTQVQIGMTYTPPAGVAGAAVAALFGKDPKSQMDEDLARMKSLLEEGKTTAESRTITREQVMPVTGRGGSPSEVHAEHRQDQSAEMREERKGAGPTGSGGVREGESSQHTRGSGATGSGGAGDTSGSPSGPMIPPGE